MTSAVKLSEFEKTNLRVGFFMGKYKDCIRCNTCDTPSVSVGVQVRPAMADRKVHLS